MNLVNIKAIISLASSPLRSQVADLLHEVIILVIELDVSATDLVLVELLLGSLGGVLVVENNQGGSGSLAPGLLDVDVALIDAVILEELADFILVNSVGETAHDQGSFLVHGTDVFGQLAGHAVIVVIGRTIEVQVVAVCDN